MNLKLVFMVIQVYTVYSAPLLQVLPFQNGYQKSQLLQQQLMELQAQQWGYIPQIPQLPLNTMPQPIIVLLPNEQTPDVNKNDFFKRINDRHENDFDNVKRPEDPDSVTIEAPPVPTVEGQKALLLLPNARLSIGDFISAIPFLPIEINVPDTISWMYNGIVNGIASIISIIGQSRPFQRPMQTTDAMKLIKSGIMPVPNVNTPIIVIPFNVANPFLRPQN